jgi:hypothetical protein
MLINSSSIDLQDRESRVLVVSVRGFRFQAANCCIYEFEDLLCQLEGASIYAPTSEFDWARKVYRTAKYITNCDRFASSIAPFPQEVSLNHEYDLLFAVLDNPWQMHLLEGIKDWRTKFRYKACFIAEMWEPDFANWRLVKEPFKNFDRVFLGVTHCVETLQKAIDVPCYYIPPAVDTLNFCPYPDAPKRTIDVCYVGRRSPEIHEALFRHARDTNFFYYYDTVKKQKLEIENSQEHRAKLISLFQRSRYNVTYYAKFNSTQETGGIQEIGYRFFEGAAAGTVMIGMPPGGEAFPRYFDWEDAVVKIDLREQDMVTAIAELDAQPEKLDRISRRNCANALLKHDWLYRWQEILATFDLEPTTAMLDRERHLRQLAESIYSEVAV